MRKVIQQTFAVNFEYPVVFTRGVFSPDNMVLKDILVAGLQRNPRPKLIVYVDEKVAEHRPGLTGQILEYIGGNLPQVLMVIAPVIVPGGEGVKSDHDGIERFMQQMADARLDRHSFVMAIGGGAVLDAVGFAASLVHRGVRMVRLPTTVLAQNDAGVGVKTAINDPAGKNFYGTFSPPFAVVNDLDFLDTLADDDWRDGIAEAFKVALIKDAGFFSWLAVSAARLARRDPEAMERLVVRCAELHLQHIRTSGDPFEMGEARPLDYGHWSAHYLEAASGYQLAHGRAVAIGIMLDAAYSMFEGWLDEKSVDTLYRGLTTAGFRLWHDMLERRDAHDGLDLLSGLERFREHLGGQLCITVPVEPGAIRDVATIDAAKVILAVDYLRRRDAALPRPS